MGVFTNLLAFQSPETKTLSSDTLTPTRTKVLVTSQTGTTDNLATINVSGFTGLSDGTNTFDPVVILRATPTHTITVKNNTGNIVLFGGADISLTGNKIVTLVYDSVVAKWMDT
jgi:hypothetical protein